MTKIIVSMFAVVCLASGCSAHVAVPATAPNTAADLRVPPSETVEVHCKANVDNFDRAADLGAGVGRWTFDEATKAWNYLTSDETKQHLANAYETTKDAAHKAYDAAVKAYDDHKASK